MEITKQTITTKVVNSEVRFTNEKNYVILTIKDNIINYARERDAYGNVVPESSVEPRETNTVYLPLWKVRQAMLLDMKGMILLKLCGGTVNPDTVMGLIGSTINVVVDPYNAHDKFTARDGSEQEHESDGADVTITLAKVDAAWASAAAAHHALLDNPSSGVYDAIKTISSRK